VQIRAIGNIFQRVRRLILKQPLFFPTFESWLPIKYPFDYGQTIDRLKFHYIQEAGTVIHAENDPPGGSPANFQMRPSSASLSRSEPFWLLH
jgi:hypothetical protein